MTDEIVDDWEQHEGDTDMPPEAVAYNKGWDEGGKQARAEVLASCIQMAKDWDGISVSHFVAKYGVDTTDLYVALAKFQPAASDLEVLLGAARREAELGGWIEGHCVGCDHCELDALWCNAATEKQAELGKARAILEKG